MVFTSEEDLRQRLHLLDLVLRGLVTSSPIPAGNLEKTLHQVEQTLCDVNKSTLNACWYIDLLLEWKEKLADYRMALERDEPKNSDDNNNNVKATDGNAAKKIKDQFDDKKMWVFFS